MVDGSVFSSFPNKVKKSSDLWLTGIDASKKGILRARISYNPRAFPTRARKPPSPLFNNIQFCVLGAAEVRERGHLHG